MALDEFYLELAIDYDSKDPKQLQDLDDFWQQIKEMLKELSQNHGIDYIYNDPLIEFELDEKLSELS
jgi:hypothetical protein